MIDISMFMRTLASLALIATTSAALAQPVPAQSPDAAKAHAGAETKALLASLSTTMDRQQAELDAAIRDATARAKWREQDRARFLQTVLRSQTNIDFDKQIAALTGELRRILQASQQGQVKGPGADQQHVARVRELVGQLKSVYERQSAYVNQQLRNANPAPRS